MSDVTSWLDALGLGSYAESFAAQQIEFDLLPELGDADLKELGVATLGHRKRLLKAIAELKGGPAAETAAPPLVQPADPPAPRDRPQPDLLAQASDAERRQLSVVFCDLVGSTAMSSRLDPEELRDILSAYRICIGQVVQRYDGFIAQHLGDGALIYFGYPQSHEDDAERAVRAALSLVDEIGRIRGHGEPLQVRLGIATGTVVVGDLLDGGLMKERGVIGETPNLAARLQGLASPGNVVACSRTRRLIADLFECQSLGTVPLKGIATPNEAWLIKREGRIDSRFDALHGESLPPLVAREEERGVLLRRWRLAVEGEGQVALLCGEPGIGKSRITAALIEALQGEQQVSLRYFCSPFYQQSALHPFIVQLERAAGLETGDTAERKLDRLQRYLSGADEGVATEEDEQPWLRRAAGDAFTAAFADLMSIPPPDGRPWLEGTPEQKKEHIFLSLIQYLERLTTRQPVLVIFEDVHWADPSSLELLHRLVDRVQGLRALLVLSYRTEFEPPWTGASQVTLLSLTRLTRRDALSIVERVAGGLYVPDELVEHILTRSDGIPLFVEELTAAVLESGVVRREGNRWILNGPLTQLAVPTTLQASLAARIDRLAPAKDVAQLAAAIGREFSYELMAAISPMTPAALQQAFDQLVTSGLVSRRGGGEQAIYLFKHALVRDAAYNTLLKGRRQQLHAAIASAMVERFAALSATQPEIVAHHYEEAGLIERAIEYWVAAGQQAVTRSANREAIAHLQRAERVLAQTAPGRARDVIELELLGALCPSLSATRGYAAPETIAAYGRARDLARQQPEYSGRIAILTGLFLAYYHSAAIWAGLALGEELLASEQARNSPTTLCAAHRMIAVSYNAIGDYRISGEHARNALDLYDATTHAPLAWRYVHDLGVAARCHLAIALWNTGDVEQASQLERDALAIAHGAGHHNTLGYTLFFAGAQSVWRRRDMAALGEAVERLREHSERWSQSQWSALATCLAGAVRIEQGRPDEGIALTEQGAARLEKLGTLAYKPQLLCIIAEGHLRAGRHPQAIATVAAALKVAEDTQELWVDPELWRIRGLAENLAGWPDQARVCFEKGIGIARDQGAVMLEQRIMESARQLAGIAK